MKYIILLFVICSLLSCSDKHEPNHISLASSPIHIDGSASDPSWSQVAWQSIGERWLGDSYTEEDFQGRYKVLWDPDHIYILAEITDDRLIDIHADGLDHYWDDDCLEVFVDADASGGDHQYNYNAFAYHIGLDNRVVDIGPDSLPHYYDHVTCVRTTSGKNSTWELSMDVYDDSFILGKQNQKEELRADQSIGFAIAYCDNDTSEERENFIGSVYVAGEDKNRGWIDAGIFQTMVLTR